MMVEQSARMIQDPVITEYVNRVGQNLVRNSDAKVPFTIKVVDSDDVNAFALPGGFFCVNSGLFLAADNEAELAGVMAHEISHVILRHATQEMTRQNYVQLSTVPLMFVIHSWGVYEAVNMAMSLALPVTFMKFSRDFEAQADYFGLQYMYKAGLLREAEGAGEAEAGSAGQGLCLASADPGSHPEEPGGDSRDSAGAARVHRRYIGVRRGEGPTGGLRKRQEGDSPGQAGSDATPYTDRG
jgi:Zn-dependent protease with chaperone function